MKTEVEEGVMAIEAPQQLFPTQLLSASAANGC